MCGFQDTLSNIMPVDWLDPYGRTPFAKDAELSVDITIVETDDGIRAKSVKNPPTSGSSRLMNAIKNALGVGFDVCDPLCSDSQADDQGKQKQDSNWKNAGDSSKIKDAGNQSKDNGTSDNLNTDGAGEDEPDEKDSGSSKVKAPKFK